MNEFGTQDGATCGLFAVNRALAVAIVLQGLHPHVIDLETFEEIAMQADICDSREELIDPVGGNYDMAVLSSNLDTHDLLL